MTDVTPASALRTRLAARNWSHGRLARLMKVHRPCVTNLCLGRRRVNADLAWKLADAFGTTPEFWMDLQRDADLRREESQC